MKQKNETNNESIQHIDLDMDKFGNIEISKNGNKPIFSKRTPVTFINAKLRTTKETVTKKDKNDNDQTYLPVFLSIGFEYKENNEIKKGFENYGGGRLFNSEINEKTNFWVGKNSALGKLIKLLEETYNFNNTIMEIETLLCGKQGEILSETISVAGDEYTKNIIKVLYQQQQKSDIVKNYPGVQGATVST
jgi:hypothetical protein